GRSGLLSYFPTRRRPSRRPHSRSFHFQNLRRRTPTPHLPVMEEKTVETPPAEPYGVLLYYRFTSVPDLDHLLSFYRQNCDSLSLLGRVRLSANGVNVTVGGKLSCLEKHIDAVKSFDTCFEGTDFKLASCNYPFNDDVARECGFTSLSIRVVKELVTFSSCPLLTPPDITNSGRHLSALEFHSALHTSGKDDVCDGRKDIVLLDARNLYETRIGKFETPGVETLDPRIRQYSDLPSWVDDHSEQLRGKNVLMYCTGGIRCEMASAYIKSKGAGFENVFQLFGGIQRYLEQFPDGGYFKGKNFVFDHRISVASSDPKILGACLFCSLSFDDYSSRCRCFHCRMLVLVCSKCQTDEAIYVCELCQRHGKSVESISSSDFGKPKELTTEHERVYCSSDAGHGKVHVGAPRKLRILCLHGFRQNASSFKGRTASLAKKLKKIAELVFVDAPHELPYIYCPVQDHAKESSSPSLQPPPPPDNCRRKFAWFIAPDGTGSSETHWQAADAQFDPLQYQQQTEGFDASVEHLRSIFALDGPFDGILGFSQGAAMAASICSLEPNLKGEINFRFAILCSGFAVTPLGKKIENGSIKIPSLHIFGSVVGKDRQIDNEASRYLASLFEDGCSVVIEHGCGHIIPTRHPYIDDIKSFLHRFI
ncbi:unnamed protein product, partial [Linum tenue]